MYRLCFCAALNPKTCKFLELMLDLKIFVVVLVLSDCSRIVSIFVCREVVRSSDHALDCHLMSCVCI